MIIHDRLKPRNTLRELIESKHKVDGIKGMTVLPDSVSEIQKLEFETRHKLPPPPPSEKDSSF